MHPHRVDVLSGQSSRVDLCIANIASNTRRVYSGNDLYMRMLDPETLSYTCGLWRDPEQLTFKQFPDEGRAYDRMTLGVFAIYCTSDRDVCDDERAENAPWYWAHTESRKTHSKSPDMNSRGPPQQ